MSSGMPVGSRIHWTYKGRWSERKYAPGKWSGQFHSTKWRRSKGYGPHPKGRTVKWRITGYQYVTKTGRGRYQTHFYFKKRLVRTGYKRPRRKK